MGGDLEVKVVAAEGDEGREDWDWDEPDERTGGSAQAMRAGAQLAGVPNGAGNDGSGDDDVDWGSSDEDGGAIADKAADVQAASCSANLKHQLLAEEALWAEEMGTWRGTASSSASPQFMREMGTA